MLIGLGVTGRGRGRREALIGLRTAWTELSGLCRNEGGTAFCVSVEGKGLSSADCAELLLKIED